MESLLLNIIKENSLNLTDKHTGHSYIPHLYDELFFPYKDKENTILEIGIREGDSLRMWEKYFPNSLIYGVDNCQDLVFKNGRRKNYDSLKTSRVTPIIDDAYDEEFVKTLPMFDIIIDDGPHTLESQIKTVELYLDKLNPNGVLVIEDIQSMDNVNEINKHIPDSYENSYCVDLRKIKNSYDDLVIVVENK